MTEVTIEKLEENLDKLIVEVGEEKFVDWEKINESQQAFSKGLEAVSINLQGLRQTQTKYYITTLKDLKQYDVKDLLKQIKEKKYLASSMKGLLPYSSIQENQVKLDVPKIKNDVANKGKLFQELNKQIVDKLFETAKCLDDFNKQLLTLQKESTSALEKSKTQENKNEQNQQQQQQQQQNNNNNNNEGKNEDKKLENENNQVDIQDPNKDKFKFSFSDEKLNEIVSQIKVSYIPDTKDLISIKTYSQIVDQSIELAQSEFIRLTFENRKERREIMHSDQKKYVQLMLDHMNEIETMLMKAQEEICVKLGITQEILEQSEMCLMERGLGQHIFMMQASVRQKIKDRLPRKNQVGNKITKDIIKYQIKLLNDKQDLFIPALKQLPINSYEATTLVPIILNLMINDYVYEEFSFEEEDYMQTFTDQQAFKDQEILDQLKRIEEGIFNLLQTCGFIPKNHPQYGQGGQGPQFLPPNQQFGGMPPYYQ